MKHNLDQMETDVGVKLPPYVSRSTAPTRQMMNDPAWMAARELFAKREIADAFNQQFEVRHDCVC